MNPELQQQIVGWVEETKPNSQRDLCWVTLTLYPTYANTAKE